MTDAGAPRRARAVGIDVDDVTVRYASGPPAVRSVDLHVAAGATLALLGPSGCGKTTLLRAIAGLERPEHGTIRLGGTAVSGAREWVAPERRHVGMVFQEPALFPHLNVGANIAFGLRRQPAALRRAAVDDMLRLVELADYGGRSPGTLSGGQQQRVALARSLAPHPHVLLLDEPFSALDTALRAQLRADVVRIIRDVGVTAVFVTHDQDEAFVVGDAVAVMREGHLLQAGAPAEIYSRPVSRWVATFVGEANFVRGVADGRVATTELGPLVLTDVHHGDLDVLVRPEALRLDPLTGSESPPAHGAAAVVEHVEYFGHSVRVRVRLTSGLAVIVRDQRVLGLRPGDAVTVRSDADSFVAWAADAAAGGSG